jgi:hypothetical protein
MQVVFKPPQTPEFVFRQPSLLDERPSPVDLAKVLYVDQEHMTVDVQTLRTGTKIAGIEYLPSSDSSKQGDAGSLPTVGSLCYVAKINQAGVINEWAIINFVRAGYRAGQGLVATKENPEYPEQDVRTRQLSRKITDKEHLIQTESGGEMLIDEGVSLLTRDLAEKKDDFYTESTVINAHNEDWQNLNGHGRSGAAVRIMPDTSGDYHHPTGLTFSYVTPDGKDPALRYKEGSNPGLVVTESLQVHHDLTDLVKDPTPQLQGRFPVRKTDLNEVSVLQGGKGRFKPVSSDRPPDSQTSTIPLAQNPYKKDDKTLYEKDAVSIQHRRDLLYTHLSNHVGAFQEDKDRYKSVLIPMVIPAKGSTDLKHTNTPFKEDHPYPNYRLRVPVKAEYSPLIHNQTAYYQTKEGYQMWVFGATLQALPSDDVEHPLKKSRKYWKGVGRSAELHSLGGVDVVLGKTKDEEESLNMTTTGQVYLHLGADSGKPPHDRRSMQVLNKVTGALESLDVYNFQNLLSPGNSMSYAEKTAAENLSVVLTTDGGISARLGWRDEDTMRKFVKNGTSDGPGRQPGGATDAHNAAKAIYGVGDEVYAFHPDIGNATLGNLDQDPTELGSTDHSDFQPDVHGRSADLHLCGDLFTRIGKNPQSDTSWTMDTDGKLLWWLGKDKDGRSLVVEMDGGTQLKINESATGNALSLYIIGHVTERVEGNVTRVITGDLSERVEGNRTIEVYGNDTLMVALNHTRAIGLNHTMMVTGIGSEGYGLGYVFTANLECKEFILGTHTVNIMGPSTWTVAGPYTMTGTASITFTSPMTSIT